MFFDSVLEELDQKRTVLTVESVKYNLNLFFTCTYNLRRFFHGFGFFGSGLCTDPDSGKTFDPDPDKKDLDPNYLLKLLNSSRSNCNLKLRIHKFCN